MKVNYSKILFPLSVQSALLLLCQAIVQDFLSIGAIGEMPFVFINFCEKKLYLFLKYFDMDVPKKKPTEKHLDGAQEPTIEYKKNIDSSNEEEEEMHPILAQLLEKALEQSEQGLGRPHEEVWAEMKAKYNFK